MFDLDRFIEDIRETLPERSRQAMKQVVARAVSDPAGIARCLGAPEKAGIQVLHKSAEFTVMNIAWAPQQVTLAHNHRLAAVIGMYAGREDNVFWRKLPNPEKYQIEPAGGAALGVGDVALLGRDIIHSVVNPLGRISAAIHVYDGDFFGADRSMWDPESLAESPYDAGVALKGMAIH
jgi:predicted metal-dependent enzyme (double-stranded beta helix superfamily)